MRLLKKWTCLILAIIMLLPTFCFAEEEITYSSFSDVDYGTTTGTAVDKLVEKNIITGYEDGTFKPGNSLTRAEFAAIIVRFLGADVSSTLPTGFGDVDLVNGASHWAKPYIKIAKDMEIINGFPDGTFRPDTPVTYEQAVKMIMCALNYKDYEYPHGFMQVALQKRLLDNSTHQGAQNAPINRGSVSNLVFNALYITPNPLYSEGTTGGGGGGGGAGRVTLPEDEAATRTLAGIIWAAQDLTLDTTLTPESGKVREDEILFKYENENEEIVTERFKVSAILKSKTVASVGKFATITLTENDRGGETVTAFDFDKKKNNNSTTISSENLISFAQEEGIYVITYYDKNDKRQTLSLEADTSNVYILYNGDSINTAPAEEYAFNPAYIEELKNGSLVCMDNDGDKKIDVLKVTSYRTGVVKSVISSSYVVRCLHGAPDIEAASKYDIADNQYRTRSVTIKTTTGSTLPDARSIKKNDVVDFAISVDGDKVEIIVSQASNSANSKVAEIYRFNEEAKTITVKNADGKRETYDLTDNYIDYLENYESSSKYEPTIGDNATLRFNKDKKVAHIEHTTVTANSKYAYVADAWIDDNGTRDSEDDFVRLTLFLTDGTQKEHKLAPSLRVDGVKNTTDMQALTVLGNAATIANEGKSAEDGNRNMDYASFIRYEESGAEITMLDTILDGEGNLSTEEDSYNTLIRSEYVYDTNEALSGKRVFSSSTFYKSATSDGFKVDSTTKYIFVPGNRRTISSYQTLASSTFKSGRSYRVEAYNCDGKSAEFVLLYVSDGSKDISYTSTFAVVTGYTADDNGIAYVTPGATRESTITFDDGRYEDFDIGDVILFSKNGALFYDYMMVLDPDNLPIDRIDSYSAIYSTPGNNDRRVKSFSVYPQEETDDSLTSSKRYRTIYGTAVDYDNGKLKINPVLRTDFVAPTNDLTLELSGANFTCLAIYDETQSASNRFQVITGKTNVSDYLNEELNTSSFSGDDFYNYDTADQIFVYTTNSAQSASGLKATFIYIIKTDAQSDPDILEGAQELTASKEVAILELEAYVDSADYEIRAVELESAIEAGTAAINEADSVDNINVALATAKAVIDTIPSDARFEEAIAELTTYHNDRKALYEGDSEAEIMISEYLAISELRIVAQTSIEDLEEMILIRKTVLDRDYPIPVTE